MVYFEVLHFSKWPFCEVTIFGSDLFPKLTIFWKDSFSKCSIFRRDPFLCDLFFKMAHLRSDKFFEAAHYPKWLIMRSDKFYEFNLFSKWPWLDLAFRFLFWKTQVWGVTTDNKYTWDKCSNLGWVWKMVIVYVTGSREYFWVISRCEFR